MPLCIFGQFRRPLGNVKAAVNAFEGVELLFCGKRDAEELSPLRVLAADPSAAITLCVFSRFSTARLYEAVAL